MNLIHAVVQKKYHQLLIVTRCSPPPKPLILTVFTTPALAAVNGNAASPIPPRVENGVTLIPMRTVFEIFGATVDYDGATKKITADKNGTRITLILNSKKAYINGSEYTLDVAAKTVNDYTVVPLRFVSEALNASVDYNSQTKLVTIHSNDGQIIIFDLTKSPSNYIGTWKLSKISVYGIEVLPQEAGVSSTLYLTDNDNGKIYIDREMAYLSWTVDDNTLTINNKKNNGSMQFRISEPYLIWYNGDSALYYKRQ